jgi:glycosyltransferase involved in cell wall biosynthesis
LSSKHAEHRSRTGCPEIVLVVHPTLSADIYAAPWIHVAGTASGMRELGRRVVIDDMRGVKWAFELSKDKLIGRAARGFSRMIIPLVILVTAVRRRRFLYIRHYHDLAPAYPLLRMARRPFAVEVNATLREEHHGLAGAPAGILRLAESLEMAMLRSAPRVVTVSEVLRSRLVERGLARECASVVHNASSVETSEPGGASEFGEGILYVGNFKPWHRVDLLLRAYAMLVDEHPCELTLVGSGDVGVLRELAQDMGIADSTRFLGAHNREDVMRLMRCSAVLVLPNTEEYGSPLKMFEYLASGRPVVLPDLPNIREVVVSGEHAILFRRGDPTALAGAMRAVLTDPISGNEMGRRARQLVREHYTWTHNARGVLSSIGMGQVPAGSEAAGCYSETVD